MPDFILEVGAAWLIFGLACGVAYQSYLTRRTQWRHWDLFGLFFASCLGLIAIVLLPEIFSRSSAGEIASRAMLRRTENENLAALHRSMETK